MKKIRIMLSAVVLLLATALPLFAEGEWTIGFENGKWLYKGVEYSNILIQGGRYGFQYKGSDIKDFTFDPDKHVLYMAMAQGQFLTINMDWVMAIRKVGDVLNLMLAN